MSLRIKSLLIVVLVLLSLLLILFILSQTILLESFRQLEDRETRQNVQRALNALDDELAGLSSSNRDYATWDDTYAFIQDGNQEYIDNNLGDEFIVNLNVSFMIFVNAAGEVVYSKAVDLKTGTAARLPSGISAYLEADGGLLTDSSGEASVSGIVTLLEGTFLVSSRPIVDSLAQQPPRGSLIFGRVLDDYQIQQLSESLRLPIEIYQVGNPQLPSDFVAARAALSSESTVWIQPIDATTISGYTLLNNLRGDEAAFLRVNQPRDIYSQGQSTILLFLVLLLVAGLLFAAGTILSLGRFVLWPLSRLSANVNAVTRSGDISARLNVEGNDELSRLGRDIDHMLEKLEQSQQALSQQGIRLQAVIKSAPIMLLAINQAEDMTLCEGNIFKTLGIDPEKVIGRKVSDVFQNAPYFIDEIRRAAKGALSESMLPLGKYTFDVRYISLPGTGVLGVATDITARVEAEQKLATTYADLKSKNERLTRLSEFLSSTVSIMSETVKRGAPQQELKDYIEFVKKEMSELN